MGSAKKSVTVKKGSKTIKASTKIKGNGKKIVLKATSASEGKYRLVVKIYNKKTGKKVKKLKTSAITVSAASTDEPTQSGGTDQPGTDTPTDPSQGGTIY